LLVIFVAVLGPDRIERPMTGDETTRLGALLRKHDYPGARLVALRFAFGLTRTHAGAKDLLGRVDLRLVRLGWDPSRVSLVRYLCRLTWSEWTHATGESDKDRRAEETYQRAFEADGGAAAPSAERLALDHGASEAAQVTAKARLAALRAVFEAGRDVVNLLWLDAALALADGTPDVHTLAAETGRDVAEFYAAAKRRKRAVLRLLAEERGVAWNDDE
jgi:hypothetical protein